MSTTGWIIFFLCLFVFSVVIYNWKSLKAYFAKMFKSSNNKKDGSKKASKKGSKKKEGKEEKTKSSKVKANESQIRPILKPPEPKQLENKSEEETKKSDISGSQQAPKGFDYKLSSAPAKKQEVRDFSSVKTDLDKEFDDIRKYLDLPKPINVKSNNVKNIPGNKVSPLSRTDNFKSEFGGFTPTSSNNYAKGVGKAGSTTGGGNFPISSKTSMAPYSNLKNSKANSISVNTKGEFPIDDFKRSSAKKDGSLFSEVPYSKNAKQTQVENKVVIDGEEIDLNKLPLNIKRLIVSNILARKNYDD